LYFVRTSVVFGLDFLAGRMRWPRLSGAARGRRAALPTELGALRSWDQKNAARPLT
jgi:hypothetical protein